MAVGSLVAGVQVARWLVQSHDDTSSSTKAGTPTGRSGQAANPWGVSGLWSCMHCTSHLWEPNCVKGKEQCIFRSMWRHYCVL